MAKDLVKLPAKVKPFTISAPASAPIGNNAISTAYVAHLNELVRRQLSQQRIIDELKKLCGIKK